MLTNALSFESGLHKADEFLVLTLSEEVLTDFWGWVSANLHECGLMLVQHGLTLVCRGALRRGVV